jgi:MFS family permease
MPSRGQPAEPPRPGAAFVNASGDVAARTGAAGAPGLAGGPRLHRLARGVHVAGLLRASLGDVAQPLADPQFRWLWFATFAWNFARWMEMTVTSWVALELTGSPWLVAVVGVCRSAFLPVAGPITGALSDRFDRVRLMKTAQWGNVLVIGAVAGLLVGGHGAYWQIVVAALWLGASWGIDWPARRALIAEMVGPQRVLQAIVLDNVTMNISRVVAPLLAGTLLYTWGGAHAFGALALSFLVGSLTLVAVRPAGVRPAPGARSMWRQIAAGLRYARQDSAVWAVLVITVLMNMLLFPYMTLLSVFAENVLHVGPIGLGEMGAMNGIGASLGLLVLSPMRTGRLQARAFAAGSCLACAALALFAFSNWYALTLLLLLVGGLGTSAFGTMQSTIILSRTDPALRGRVMGLLALCIGSAPLGSLLIGVLVETTGPQVAVGASCLVGGCLVTAVALRARLFDLPPSLAPAQPPSRQ